MRYETIPSDLFTGNRARLSEQLPPRSLAVIHSNDVLSTNADGVLPFKQNTDIFYLTGADQEESILLLFPDHHDPKMREVLFVRETNEHLAVWEGQKLTLEQAREVSGVQSVYWTNQFEAMFKGLMNLAENVYLNENDHLRAANSVQTRDARFIEDCRQRFPLHNYKRLAPLLHRLRMIKSEPEVALLRTACDITDKGFRRLLGYIEPGISEFQVEAEFLHEIMQHRSRGYAYPPIVGAGGNACVLHYVENNAVCEDGQMLLLDIGAEYANYNADMTRTVPVNGRFSDRQRAVYESVRHILCACEQMLRPGILMKDYMTEINQLMDSALIDLGLLDKAAVEAQDPAKPLRTKYFMHGVSHHLGLDVHDVGPNHEAVAEGMVYTIEPGIYIREENLGCRLENDYYIGKDANENLMGMIPIEADEIETLMNS